MTFHRCFLSAGSPASFPSKSRVVEAICLKLCDRYTQPRRERSGGKTRHISRYSPIGFISTPQLESPFRWKQILTAYNEVRRRLLNSQALLEGTNLMLFSINETTLLHWYKNTTRRNEVKMLLQGLPGIPSQSTSSEPLQPALQRPGSPPPPPDNPHVFPEVQDTTGLFKEFQLPHHQCNTT